MPRPTLRIRTLLGLLVVASMMPVAVLAVWHAVSGWNRQRQLVDVQALELARAVSVAVDREVGATRDRLLVFGSLDLLDRGDLDRFRDLVLAVIPAQLGWRSVMVLDASGRLLLDTSRMAGGGDAGAAPWHPAVLETRTWVVSNLFDDPAAGGEHFVVAVPVIRRGDVRWVIAAEISARTLSDLLRRQNPPPGGVITLVDRQPVILARTRGQREYVGKPPSTGFQSALARMSEGSWREVLLEGTPAYASLSRSPVTGWAVGVGFPAEAVDAPVRRALVTTTGIGLGVLALALTAAVVLGRTLVKALGSASRAARSLAHGEPVTTSPSALAEIDDLSAGIGEAAEILVTRQRERDEAARAREQALADRELALSAERAARAVSLEQEARLTVTLRSIGDGVIATDAGGRVTMANPIAEALTGWQEPSATGRVIGEVCPLVNEHTREAVESPVARVLREGAAARRPMRTLLVARDGRETPVETTAAPIRAADGSLLGVVLVVRNATEARAAERQRLALLRREQRARLEAEALSRSKDDFVAIMSHELRTPLNAIFGWVHVLRGGSLDEAQRAHALEVIERSTRSQARLVEDLLDMSRVITGNMRLDVRRLEAGRALSQAVDAARPAADAKGVTVTLTDRAAGVEVTGDPARLQQVFWNLLVNAVKFTPRGGRVEVTADREDRDVVVRVHDTGAGIAREDLAVIFELFRRGATEPGGVDAGLGIGLSLVRHLVDLHGGAVTAESDGAGRGATFTVRLPVADHASAPTTIPGVRRRAAAGAADSSLLDGVRALVVDDDPDARELLAVVLRLAGADVQAADSLREAESLIGAEVPDVLLSDVAMPDGTGYDLIARLRARPATASLPAIAVTALGRPEDREQAIEAGFDVHFIKPAEPGQLLQAVARLVGAADAGAGG